MSSVNSRPPLLQPNNRPCLPNRPSLPKRLFHPNRLRQPNQPKNKPQHSRFLWRIQKQDKMLPKSHKRLHQPRLPLRPKLQPREAAPAHFCPFWMPAPHAHPLTVSVLTAKNWPWRIRLVPIRYYQLTQPDINFMLIIYSNPYIQSCYSMFKWGILCE